MLVVGVLVVAGVGFVFHVVCVVGLFLVCRLVQEVLLLQGVVCGRVCDQALQVLLQGVFGWDLNQRFF